MHYSIIGTIGYGVGNALSKIPGKAVGNIKGSVLISIFTSLILTSIAFLSGFANFNPVWFLICFLFGMFGYFPLLFFVKAVSTGKAGVVIPIIDLGIVVSLLCSYIFLGQSLSGIGIFFVFLILIGVILLSLNLSDLKNSKVLDLSSGILYALIAAFLWGIGYFIWYFPVQYIGALNSSFLIEVGVLTAGLIHLLLFKRENLKSVPRNIWFVSLLIGIFAATGTYGINLGIKEVGPSITYAIVGAKPFVSALVAYFIFKEKLSAKQVFCLVIIALGVAGVSLFK